METNEGINFVFSHRSGTIYDRFENLGGTNKKLQTEVLKKLLTLLL
jgi:hypothetical protein